MEVWDREKQLFEFSKEFLTHGERSLHKLLTGEYANHSARHSAEAASYLLPRGADFVATVITGWLDRIDKVSRRNNRLKVQHAIDPTGANDDIYKQKIRTLLLKSAVEIFTSYELQLQFVFRRINDKYNSVSRSQAIKVLAEFASKACTKTLAESPETFPENWHLHEAVLTQDKKFSEKIKHTRDTVVAGQDKLILMLENGQKIISKSDFFKLPIPAFNQQGENSKLSLQKEDVKRWKDGGSQLGMLRRPFDFEWKRMMTGKGKAQQFINPGKRNPKTKILTRIDLTTFKWSDPSSLIQELNSTISEELPLQSINDLYGKVDNLITETKENLAKALGDIQGDLKTELLKNNEIVLRVLENMKGRGLRPTSSMKRSLKELRFNIRDPISSFTGREEFLEEIHQEFSSIKDNFVLSQVKVISGLGGVGKSETVRKYIHKYENNYHHIIWIDSETNNTMTQNFRTLAENELKIQVKTPEGNWRPMDQIVKQIYEIICQHSSLFIFDNAECYEDWEQQNNDDGNNNNGIKQFLPPYLNSKLIKPKILITSRNQQWKLLPSKPMTLDILTKEESVQFIMNRLDMDYDPKKSYTLSSDLADLLGGLPLSLQVAASCIYKSSEKKSVSVRQAIEYYIEEYNAGSNSDEFLHYFDKSIVPKSIFLTMLLSFEKIAKFVHQFGPIAVKLIKYLSFLYSDEIPKDLIFSLFPNQQQSNVEDGLALLKKFSLIKIFNDHIAVHRQVQQATIEKMKEDGENFLILQEILDNLKLFISTKTQLYPFLKVSLTNALRLVHHLKSHLDDRIEFQQFLEFVANKVFILGRHVEALEIYTILSSFYSRTLGDEDTQTLSMEYHVARCLEFSGHFDDAMQKYRRVYEEQRKLFGVSHPLVWKTLSKIASLSHFMESNESSSDKILTPEISKPMESDVLKQLEQLEESLEIVQNVFHAKSETKVISVRNSLSQLVKGNPDLPHSLLKKVLSNLKDSLGQDHPQVITAHYNIASILTAQEKYDEALNLLQEMGDKRRKSLGQDHLVVFMNQMAISFILIKQGHVQEGVDLCNVAYEGQISTGGDGNPTVIQVMNEMAYTMYTIGMYQDAWNLYERVDERQREGHPEKLVTKHGMGLILLAQGKYWEAFKLYEIIYEARKEIYEQDHPDVLAAQINMALALEKYGKDRRALKIYNVVYDKHKKLFGEAHPNTLSLQNTIINLFNKQRNRSNLYSHN